VLDNTDPGQQDIVVTRKLNLRIGSHKVVSTFIDGYCCQSSNSSPITGQPYLMGRTNDSNLIKLCSFIDKHHCKEYVEQNAVWAVANNHSSSSVGDPSDTTVKDLLKLIRTIKHEKEPTWYYVSYLKVPGIVYSGISNQIIACIEYDKKTDGELYVVVCDSMGRVVKTLAKDNYAPASKLNFRFDIQVLNWNKGKYYIKIFENKESHFEKAIEV
jgi:hypothetical protein